MFKLYVQLKTKNHKQQKRIRTSVTKKLKRKEKEN